MILDLLAGVYVLLAGFILVRLMREIVQAVVFPFWVSWKAAEGTWKAFGWTRKKLKSWQRKKPYGDRKLADRKALTKAGNLEPGGFVVGKIDGRRVHTRYEYGCLMFGRPAPVSPSRWRQRSIKPLVSTSSSTTLPQPSGSVLRPTSRARDIGSSKST